MVHLPTHQILHDTVLVVVMKLLLFPSHYVYVPLS